MLEHTALQGALWRASPGIRRRGRFSYKGLDAEPDARWVCSDPFAEYEPITRKREPNPGPHAKFLRLKELWVSDRPKFFNAADAFASTYGLLGLFHLELFPPTLPRGKVYIAPEAVVENDGRLRCVDPAGEGLKLLRKMINAQLPSRWHPFVEEHNQLPPDQYPFTEEQYEAVALPEEINFARKDLLRFQEESVPALGHTVPWTDARRDYDALLVLDPASVWSTGVSVLVRREDHLSWMLALKDFPAPPYTDERRLFLIPYVVDQMRMAGVSDAPSVGESGKPIQGWRCSTLLGAMYAMLYLDLMGNAELRQCALHDCMDYFRPGAQNGLYCRPRHTSLATSRRQLGKEV